MNNSRPTFLELALKTIATHTVSYFIMGLLALVIADYATLFAKAGLNQFMRPTSDPMVMAGPLFQPLRGLLFAAIFYLLREPFFGKKNGWLVLWAVLAGIGILNTFGPAPGSIEGMIYTVVPFVVHLQGLPEVLLQSLLLSAILSYWINHPRKWLNWLMGVLFFVLMVFPVLGLLVGSVR